MATHILSPDTQAVLLLCGRFGMRTHTAAPLTQTEYNRMIKWLRERKMHPADLLHADGLDELQSGTPPVEVIRLIALLERGGALALAVEKWDSRSVWVISRYDQNHYPERIASLGGQAPPVLYGAGDSALLSHGGVAVVGSRDIDDEGLDYTQRLARACAKQGVQIVSGGARGVDSAAMVTALEAGGTAVGVLPDSLLKVTISNNYREALVEKNLVLISPYDPESGFNVGNAMGRNKYVYALADLALVVSSSDGKGGTWEGAVEALAKQHVFVRLTGHVPPGNTRLFSHGAIPFPEEPWEDIAEIIQRGHSSEHQQLDLGASQTSVEIEQQSPITFAKAPVDDTRAIPISEVKPEQHQIEPESQPIASLDTAFDLLLPRLLQELKQPRDIKSLANALDVRDIQMKDWLNKAMATGKVSKQGKSARYVAKSQAPSLF